MRAKKLKLLPNYKPILYWYDKLILAKGSDIFLTDLNLNKLNFIATLPCTWLKRIFSMSRLLTRIFRLEVGPACNIYDEKHCLIFFGGIIYKLNLTNGKFKKEFTLPKRRKILNFTYVDVPGFKNGVYFGEYFSNPDKRNTKLFYRNEYGVWDVVFEFKNGEINHVHNIVQDYKRNCLYILTGDFGEAAAIWKVSSNFQTVSRFLNSGQNSRACWLKVDGDRLIYATDSQLETNYLRNINLSGGQLISSQNLQKISGSSIYFLETLSRRFIFSTAVEPNVSKGNKYLALLSRCRGPGIHSDYSYVYFGRFGEQASQVFKAKKDFYPFGLFQFGTIQFPGGVSPEESLLHVYGSAVKDFDGSTLLLKLSS